MYNCLIFILFNLIMSCAFAQSEVSVLISVTDTNTENYRQSILDYNEGLAFFKKNKYPEALTFFNKCISLNPNYASALVNRGAVKMELKDQDGAYADFNKALILDSLHDEAYYRLSEYRKVKGNKQDAIIEISRAISINDKNAIRESDTNCSAI